MTSDVIGFAAFLLIALSVVVLSVTSVVSLLISRNRYGRVSRAPGEPVCVAPVQSDSSSLAFPHTPLVICMIFMACATLLFGVNLLSSGVIPAWRMISCLAGVAVVGPVTAWLWHRRTKVTA